MNTAEPIRDREKLKAMVTYYKSRRQFRNYALVVFGVHTALRISDQLRLRWSDILDEETGEMRDSVTVHERKTGKQKTIALHKALRKALRLLYEEEGRPDGSRFIFENKRTGRAISRIQAYRVIRAAARAVSLSGSISCHSLRKTFGYHAWKQNIPLAIIMEIYNHSSFAITRRYLGITQDDKNDAYLQMNLL